MGDDCAIMTPLHGSEVVVTTDFSLETIHFHRDWHSPESAGHRCLARGLSDLAAMGARPMAAFLSLALPQELLRSRRGKPAWRDRFFDGLLALAEREQVPLAGGDTAQSPALEGAFREKSTGLALADIVLVGSVPRGRALLRSGARSGDVLYVTGRLGGAAAELAQLAAQPQRFRRYVRSQAGFPNPHPHLYPEPRVAVGTWLVRHRRATAAIDISDGLSTDLHHLCEESGLAATLDAGAIPVHTLARNQADGGLNLALHGGEDYELLFTAPPDIRIPRIIAGVPVARIGQMHRKSAQRPRVELIDPGDGKVKSRTVKPGGWQHYR